MGTQAGHSASTKPVEVIAPNWTKMMAPASGTVHKVDLPPRNGKKRSIAIEIEANNRGFRIRARDYSRSRPVVARSLGINCPRDITSKEDALAWLKQYPEKFMLFQGVLEEMQDGYWMGELRTDHVNRPKVSRTYPFGSLGHALRWHLQQEIGSDNQKDNFGDAAFKLLAMQSKSGEVFGHIECGDLDEDVAMEMTTAWRKEDFAYSTLRGAYALLSTALTRGESKPKSSGVRRGIHWGAKNAKGCGNPLNTERKEIDRIIEEMKIGHEDKRPQPFTPPEAEALCKAFLRNEYLKPYFPLFAILISTGARPNEVLALRWDHILGLWEGHQLGYHVPRAKEFVLTGNPVLFELGVDKRNRIHIDPEKRFKNVKNGTEHQPELNTFVPGYENLFKKAIEILMPRSFECMANKEWRKRLVFQGPGASDDYRLPYDWHNFRRYFMRACAEAGVRYRRPYNLRHTYVSMMCRIGEYSQRQIAYWIGDTESTMRKHYSGVLNFPQMDKVKNQGSLSAEDFINGLSAAEKQQMLIKLASSMNPGG